MRHSQVRPEHLHSLGISDEPGDETRREGEDLRLDTVAKEGDGPGHDRIIAYPLC